jgi:flavorubredoxin
MPARPGARESKTMSQPMFSLDPEVSPIHHAPIRVADETFLIQYLSGEGVAPMGVYMNTLVIRGKEPVIVDTGIEPNRERWLTDVFSLVDPEDVKWVFISHDDPDHVGNLRPVIEACPNATIIANWFTWERMFDRVNIPLGRMRWIEDGGSFDAGDRTFHLVRPPIFDGPTTRGLYDSKTGLYWASDAFSAPVTRHTEDVGDLDPAFWTEGFSMFARAISPWHQYLDSKRYNALVDRVAVLDPKVIAMCHGPVITGSNVAKAIEMTRTLPDQGEVQLPGQADLEAMIAAFSHAAEEIAA